MGWLMADDRTALLSDARLPASDLRVSFGTPQPGSSRPMPARSRAAYKRRIRCSAEQQSTGARRARELFAGSGNHASVSAAKVRL
jgi:hypothetical protein